jgi:hypothetical protein
MFHNLTTFFDCQTPETSFQGNIPTIDRRKARAPVIDNPRDCLNGQSRDHYTHKEGDNNQQTRDKAN